MHIEIILSIVFLSFTCSCIGVRHEYFSKDKRYSDVLPVSNILWTKLGTHVSCALDCYIDANCESFFNDDEKCHGYGYRLIDNIPKREVIGMKYYEMTGPMGNLAAGKPVLESSSHEEYAPENAVDSLRNGFKYFFTNLPTCSHTAEHGDSKPFWEVDLLSRYRITAVAFLGRNDCCADRNSGLNITVAESSAGPYNLCYYYPLGPGFVNEMKTFYCTQPLTGRLVRISRDRPIISVCEFEVYGFTLLKA